MVKPGCHASGKMLALATELCLLSPGWSFCVNSKPAWGKQTNGERANFRVDVWAELLRFYNARASDSGSAFMPNAFYFAKGL